MELETKKTGAAVIAAIVLLSYLNALSVIFQASEEAQAAPEASLAVAE
ncbi:hypothetical protein [Erythrobacter ani]|uniref:Uncharacterized protein n=1 Tax=Erythrobacter ani TaxID=2827235 RepID=A0ABS6SRU7_9SPHN|nr:hypothetical protein [Erythrobacter ani]MBV7267546.1 hypothetical protein [Erythrobacter ani]